MAYTPKTEKEYDNDTNVKFINISKWLIKVSWKSLLMKKMLHTSFNFKYMDIKRILDLANTYLMKIAYCFKLPKPHIGLWLLQTVLISIESFRTDSLTKFKKTVNIFSWHVVSQYITRRPILYEWL